MDDLNPESLWRFAIRDFGPLIVGMDAHGGSLYREVQDSVAARRAAVLAKLGAA
jgi:L(+)-tartrate dehydratase beta subunit